MFNLNLNLGFGSNSNNFIDYDEIEIRAPECYLSKLQDDQIDYVAFKSGRGSTKTFTALQYFLKESFNPENEDCFFILGRELGTSIDHGIKETFTDLIRQVGKKNELDLYSHFEFKNGSITNTQTNCKIIFMGFRVTSGDTQGSQLGKFKGLHKVRILFIDEAESLSEDMLNVLFPTVNRSGSIFDDAPRIRFVFALNPRLKEDPVISKVKTFKNHAIVHANIFDIEPEFQDKQLLKQAEAEKDEYYYPHVWLGEPFYKFSGAPFAKLKSAILKNTSAFYGGYAFLDLSFAGGDYTSLSVVKEYKGRLIFFTVSWKRAWNECVSDVVEIVKEYKLNLAYESNAQGTVPQDKFYEFSVPSEPILSTDNKVNRIYAVTYKTIDKLRMIEELCDRESEKMIKNYNAETSKFDDPPDSLTNCLIWMGYDYKELKLK